MTTFGGLQIDMEIIDVSVSDLLSRGYISGNLLSSDLRVSSSTEVAEEADREKTLKNACDGVQ